MKKLAFTKMHGLGNDFMVVDGVRQNFNLDGRQIQAASDRHYGVGFDQLLVVAPSPSCEADFAYLIFNRDGSPAEQCGNGARCIARFIHEQKLSDRKTIKLWTQGKITQAHLEEGDHVTVDITEPCFEPEQVPFMPAQSAAPYFLDVAGQTLEFHPINLGNPHAVLLVSQLEAEIVKTVGAEISTHPLFPHGVNVGFMQINSPKHIFLQVYERGAGPTLACGSGACAATAIGRILGRLGSEVRVTQPGGELWISWPGKGVPIRMRGPAQFVYEGHLFL